MTKPQESVNRLLPNVLELGVQAKGERSTSGPDSDINTNPDPIDLDLNDIFIMKGHWIKRLIWMIRGRIFMRD